MGFFKKRDTVTQNIAYLALMAAINVIFVLLTAILQPLMFVMIFILPLTSTVVTLFCQKKYFPIYFVVTTALCLLVTSWASIFDTFFYVIPSMISGFAFGFIIEKRWSAIYIISISTIIQYGLTFLTFLTLDAILPDINFIDLLLRMFGLAEYAFKDYFIHVFLYLLSVIQTILTYAIIKTEILKLGFDINLEVRHQIALPIINFVLLLLAVSMIFIYGPLVYIFLFINLGFILYEFIELMFTRNRIIIALGITSLLVGFIFYVGFNSQIVKPLQIILFATSFFLVGALYLGNYLFVKKTNSAKIE